MTFIAINIDSLPGALPDSVLGALRTIIEKNVLSISLIKDVAPEDSRKPPVTTEEALEQLMQDVESVTERTEAEFAICALMAPYPVASGKFADKDTSLRCQNVLFSAIRHQSGSETLIVDMLGREEPPWDLAEHIAGSFQEIAKDRKRPLITAETFRSVMLINRALLASVEFVSGISAREQQ